MSLRDESEIPDSAETMSGKNGKNRKRKAGADAQSPSGSKPSPLVYLPSRGISIEAAAALIFKPLGERGEMFLQDGIPVEIYQTTTGSSALRPVTPHALCSRIEILGTPVAYRADKHGEWFWKPVTCSKHIAEIILASRAAQTYLPRISMIASCAVITNDGSVPRILAKGYHKEFGGILVVNGSKPPIVGVEEAIGEFLKLLHDFPFATNGDTCRAIAALITPALIQGGLLGQHRAPIIMTRADDSQSGKTFLLKLIAAIYGDRPFTIAKRDGGVGGLEEEFGDGLAKGRPFILADNLRGTVSSQYIESTLTSGVMTVRIPHRPVVEVDTSRVTVMVSGNDLKVTPDLINRCLLIRITKRPIDHQFCEYPEGDILDHVRANQSRYLGCVFSVVRAWIEAGCPKTSENRHSFRGWARSLDWIVHTLFNSTPGYVGFPPLLDEHEGASSSFNMANTPPVGSIESDIADLVDPNLF